MANQIRVLVVDDSAFIRKTITGFLSSDPEIRVIGEAADGEDAVKKVKDLNPDIVTMDIEMPRMTGLQALKLIMVRTPLPVIMVSSLTEEGAKETIKALEYGAVDYIPKNLSGNITNIVNIKNELINKIKIFGKKKIVFRTVPDDVKPAPLFDILSSLPERTKVDLVIIGASTGGPKSLQEVIPKLPKNFPCGIIVVQHMLPVFTSSFADRMQEISQIEVREAKDRDVIKPGLVLIAPGGHHLIVRQLSDEAYVKLDTNPQTLHIPSVDVTMESAVKTFSERVLGVIMTGMGEDGKAGIMAIKAMKGRTIAQDEATSVIFGMPKAAIESGCVDKVVPLGRIAEEIINML